MSTDNTAGTGGQVSSRRRRRVAGGENPAIWVGYGKLAKLFRTKNGLTRQELADAVGYSCEQVASIEQGRRPAKSTFTKAAERVLGAGGVLAELQEDVDRAKLPKFFQDFALIEAEAVSRFDIGEAALRNPHASSDDLQEWHEQAAGHRRPRSVGVAEEQLQRLGRW
ncbi:helix-turn-helix domain-containing protein [Streptomyces kebangsaanensis]|uniref:helix-turn-helix domain-containing protein n=1 Tax=Streptomyces kebangsaanensis TaxID=864058 RepID=UPI0009A10A34